MNTYDVLTPSGLLLATVESPCEDRAYMYATGVLGCPEDSEIVQVMCECGQCDDHD